jgi:chloride channel 7
VFFDGGKKNNNKNHRHLLLIVVSSTRFILSRWAKVLEVIVVCSVTVSVGFIMIYYVDDCKPLGAKDAVEFPIQVIFWIQFNNG